MENYRRRFSEDVKVSMVSEVESGALSIREAAYRCGAGVS